MLATSKFMALSTPNYRPDIDGLRAIAVISVILFHIDKALIPGGFVGVDIFFVISGYLISLHILKDLGRERFSLVQFYRRRIKRIVPAMLVVVGVTLLLTQLIFLPEDAEATADSALWSLFSSANIYFWLHQDTSYFAAASNEKPLLHLWSLGVEEQFYIFWPLILMLVFKLNRSKLIFISTLLVAVFSFLLGEAVFTSDPMFVYYMLPTRAGELLVGALASQIVLKRKSIPYQIANLIACLGSILIGYSFLTLSEEGIFPGLRAIPPTIGAAMLIIAGHYRNTWPNQLLKIRPLVWVGLISYSAYLWHWPLLAFLRYGRFELGISEEIIILLLTLVLAWFSYRFIECPARLSTRPALDIFFQQYAIPTVILSLVALTAMKIDGYGIRWLSKDYKTTLASIRDATKPAYEYDYVCQRQKISSVDLNNENCIVGDKNSIKPAAVLWGDSNAAHYIGMLSIFAQEQKFSFRNVEIGSCPPLLSDPENFVATKRLIACRDSLQLVKQNLNDFPVVILSANYPDYQARSESFLKTFFDTVKELTNQGKLVIIIGKVPIINTYDRTCNEKALSFPLIECKEKPVRLSELVSSINNQLSEFAHSTPNVKYFDITEYLCPGNQCSAFDKTGASLYYDEGHLNLSGSWKIGKDILLRSGVPAAFTVINQWSNSAKLSTMEN